MDDEVSGLGTVHLLLTLNVLSKWILPLHVQFSMLKRKSSSSAMDGIQRRRTYKSIKIIDDISAIHQSVKSVTSASRFYFNRIVATLNTT